MTTREEKTRQARKLVSDEQLIEFLRAAWLRHGVHDAGYAVSCLGNGERLNDFFYTGKEFGYYLSASPSSRATLKIVLGCQDDPLSDEGSEWLVSFSGNEISSLLHVVSWIC